MELSNNALAKIAKAAGRNKFEGSPCKVCQSTVRSVHNGQCVLCNATNTEIARQKRRNERGLKYEGDICERHGTRVRYGANGRCIECVAEINARSYDRNYKPHPISKIRTKLQRERVAIFKRKVARWRTFANVTGSISLLIEMFAVVPEQLVRKRLAKGWSIGDALTKTKQRYNHTGKWKV